MAAPKAKSGSPGGIASLVRQAGQQAKQAAEGLTVAVLDADGNPVAADPRMPTVPRIFTVLDYIESDWGLGMKLYPAQKFLVKLYYYLPLDDVNKTIEIRDMFATKVLYTFTEVEYLKYLYDEGRCNIGEQDHERRELVLAIGRRAGKCVKGDTLVLTDKGIFPIEQLGDAPEEGYTPLEVTIAQEGSAKAKSAYFYNGGVKPTYTIKSKSGYSVCGTGSHRLKVLSAATGCVEWRYSDEIRPGDYLAIHRQTDLWASEYLDVRPHHNESGTKKVTFPATLTEEWGRLLGYLVGDGSWSHTQGVAVTVEHPETWVELKSLFDKLLGSHRVQMDLRTKNTGRLEFPGIGMRQFLDALGWDSDCGRHDKHVPWSILRSPKPVVSAFLRGLFETDGSAEGGGRHITFSSSSFRLAHEVQVLLLNMGIVSNVGRKWNSRTKRHYANLSIKGVRSRRLFAHHVGFDSEKKSQPMLEALETAQEGKSGTESVPHQYQRIRDLLESIPKRNPARGELGWGRSKVREASGNACKPGAGENLSYIRLERMLAAAQEHNAGQSEMAHFQTLLDQNYFFDPVASVEEGEDQVYDLNVPQGSSFVANGLTNHNTTLSGIFASYEVYRLLNFDNPQAYYGLPNGNRIQIVSVATDKDQAGLLYNEVTSHLAQCDYFKPYISNNTLSHVQFRTRYDIEQFGPNARHQNGKFVSLNGKASLRVTFKSCIAKGLRGSGNIVIILDEMAHFQDKGQSSAADIYNAVTPSAAAFSPKNPMDSAEPVGEVESRIIAISSPLNKSGKFFDLFHLAMGRGPGSENLLAIQAPTWEVNPTLPSSYYRQKFHADPAVFMTEHGAMFSDRVRGWIEREVDLMACVNPDRVPVEVGVPRYPHHMGIDIGLMDDGTSVFITHVENGKIILDYHEYWQAGVDWRESNPHLRSHSVPYARTLSNVERLDFEEISKWIYGLTKKFYIVDGLFDRWNGIPLEQALVKMGLTQFQSVFFQRDLTSKIFQSCKMLMYDKRLELYDHPRPEGGKHSQFIAELLSLQAQQMSKNVVIVAAPDSKNYHDDMSDAFVRSVWLAAERMRNTKQVYGSHMAGVGRGNGSMTPIQYQRMRMRRHGLTDRGMVGIRGVKTRKG